MLDLCRRTKRVQLAEMLMSEMIQAGIKPNIVTQRTLIGVYSMMGDACGLWMDRQHMCLGQVRTQQNR